MINNKKAKEQLAEREKELARELENPNFTAERGKEIYKELVALRRIKKELK